MVIASIPALASIAGVLLYALASNPKLAEIGRILFFAGILVVLFALQGAGAVRIP